MLHRSPSAKLRDPDYFGLHLQAARAIREVGDLGWYDSHFLRRFTIAQRYLSRVRPDALPAFRAGFMPLTPRPGSRETLIDAVFDAETAQRIIAVSRAAQPDSECERQARENDSFGRDVLWNIPFFIELQERVRPLVEELAGRPLVSSYNFLSRYGAKGKCDLHMDHPDAMYTFDYCIEQDAPWPIHVSRVVDWIGSDPADAFDPERIIADPDLDFADRLLHPNQALLFNGSSQWHYRRPKTAGGYCHLLFFHYYPQGCDDLVVPHRWAAHFGIAELQPLCDLFLDPRDDGLA